MVDIYGYAEVRSAGQWVFAGRLVTNPYRKYDPDEPEVMPEELFHSNHKELAAILTDTGNPIRSSRRYVPVTTRRGLPSDLSPALSAWLRREDVSSLETTWFTASEAASFGWHDQIMRRRAYVPVEAASLFAGCPRGFPLATWPVGVPVSISEWSLYGVQVEWLESYAEIVPEFTRIFLPQLEALGPADEVRLIVWASW